MGVFEKITVGIGLILASLTFLGFNKTASDWFSASISVYSWTLFLLTILSFLSFGGGLSVRHGLRGLTKRALRHLDIVYFGRNNDPHRPCGDRVIRNTQTNQAFIVDERIDKMAVLHLIEAYTDPTQISLANNTSTFSQGYTIYQKRPEREDLQRAKTSRWLSFLLWVYL